MTKYITLAGDGLDACVERFCERYRDHQQKIFYYVYDQTATGKRSDTVEYYSTVKKALQRNDWMVVEIYTGAAPGHYQKYIDTQSWLKADVKTNIRLNTNRCPFTIISISGAPAKTNRGRTEKDKKYEDTTKYPTLDQRETTHFSDVFDMINHAVLKLSRISPFAFVTTGIYMK